MSKAVVADVPDVDVLQVDRAAPDLDAVIDVVHDVDVVDVGVAAQATQRQTVELVVQADDLAAVAQREVRDRAAVVVVVAAAVQQSGPGERAIRPSIAPSCSGSGAACCRDRVL
jgi:hypothetical protein